MGFLFKTWGDSIPNGKPQIYFSCHPDDFSKYFERICHDIFQCQDCVIHYKEDMAQTADKQDLELMLDECQLFVIPVTYKLLAQENCIVQEELPLARSKNMPILPLVMENGLDAIYGRPHLFGEAQYLTPDTDDATCIAYQKKLNMFLSNELVSKELTKRINDAFRGKIFLSYRKKDRHYANALIKLIHEDCDCKDISVWYDEFLIPGESYSDNIQQAMETSDLYLLLVTPNLLEDPNYVKDVEYPAAKKIGLPILSAEMAETDLESVFTQFPGLFRCPKTEDEEERTLLLDCIKAVFEDHHLGYNDREIAERFYLIGRAYFSGIGVETDRLEGSARIEVAAKYHNPEAMVWTYWRYRNKGHYTKALHWADQLVNYYQEKLENEPDLVFWLQEKARTLQQTGLYEDALECANQAWEVVPKELGADHPAILSIQELIGTIYRDLGHNNLAYEFLMHVVNTKMEVLGEGHPDTIESMRIFASVLNEPDEYDIIIEAYQLIYSEKIKIYGCEHPSAMEALKELGLAYNRTERYHEALDCLEQTYNFYENWLDPNHPEIWQILGDYAIALAGTGQVDKADSLGSEAYKAYIDIYGQNNPKTISYYSWLQSIRSDK